MATKKKRGLLAECIYYLGHSITFAWFLTRVWAYVTCDRSASMIQVLACLFFSCAVCGWRGFSFWLRRLGLTFLNALFLQQHILPSRWYYGGKLWMWGIRKNLFIISTATRMESRTFFLLIRSPKEKAPVFILPVFASFCLLAEISFQCSQ